METQSSFSEACYLLHHRPLGLGLEVDNTASPPLKTPAIFATFQLNLYGTCRDTKKAWIGVGLVWKAQAFDKVASCLAKGFEGLHQFLLLLRMMCDI